MLKHALNKARKWKVRRRHILHDEEGLQEKMQCRIEILSCSNLLAGDRDGLSDPFVQIFLGDENLHTTKHVNNTLNPKFTKADEASFDFEWDNAQEVFELDGLAMKIRDWDFGKKSDLLGSSMLPFQFIYDPDNVTREYKITSIDVDTGETIDAGFIKIRCRPLLLPPLPSRNVNKNVRFDNENIEFDTHIHHGDDLAPIILQPDERLKCSIEIISCRDLIPADENGLADPYVKVSFNGRTLHRTGYDAKTLNPSFIDSTKARFKINFPAKDVLEKDGLLIDVKDLDKGKENDMLGNAFLPFRDMYMAESVEKEYRIFLKRKDLTKHAKNRKNDPTLYAGYIKIRCVPIVEEVHESARTKIKTFTRRFSGSSLNSDDVSANSKKQSSPGPPTKALPPTDPSELIQCTIQIISCRDLLPSDKNGYSDPYVKIYFNMGHRELHRTNYIRRCLNPKFYDESLASTNNNPNNFKFYLECTAQKLFTMKGLRIEVMDKDYTSKDDPLGTTIIPYEDIYPVPTNTRKDYCLIIAQEDVPIYASVDDAGNAGFVTIRCGSEESKSDFRNSLMIQNTALKQSGIAQEGNDLNLNTAAIAFSNKFRAGIKPRNIEERNGRDLLDVGLIDIPEATEVTRKSKRSSRKINEDTVLKKNTIAAAIGSQSTLIVMILMGTIIVLLLFIILSGQTNNADAKARTTISSLPSSSSPGANNLKRIGNTESIEESKMLRDIEEEIFEVEELFDKEKEGMNRRGR